MHHENILKKTYKMHVFYKHKKINKKELIKTSKKDFF